MCLGTGTGRSLGSWSGSSSTLRPAWDAQPPPQPPSVAAAVGGAAGTAAADLPDVLWRARNARQLAERTLTVERQLALERARAGRLHRELLAAEAQVLDEAAAEDLELRSGAGAGVGAGAGAGARATASFTGRSLREPLELPPSASLPRLDSLDRRLRALRAEHRTTEERLEELRDSVEHFDQRQRQHQLDGRSRLSRPAPLSRFASSVSSACLFSRS